MSSDKFALKVFTPEGEVLDSIVREVYLPSSDGEIGLLPQHCHYTGMLGTGTLRYTTADTGETGAVNISGGFCSFSHDTLTVLADRASYG